MKKKVFGRQLKRDTNQRRALFKGLISSLILKEKIKTTEAKAKAIRSSVEKIVTKARKGEVARNFLQRLVHKDALDKLIKDIAPRFDKRQGGYIRIVRLGERFSDKAKMVLLEWTEGAKALVLTKGETIGKTTGNKQNATVETQKKSEPQKATKIQRKRKLSVSK